MGTNEATKTPTKTKRKLTLKQQRFIEEYLKTQNATKAVQKVYNVKSYGVARSIGSENLTKPNVIEELRAAQSIARDSIIELAREAKKEEVRLRASQDILDRTEGKAITRSLIQTEHINSDLKTLSDAELVALLGNETTEPLTLALENTSYNKDCATHTDTTIEADTEAEEEAKEEAVEP